MSLLKKTLPALLVLSLWSCSTPPADTTPRLDNGLLQRPGPLPRLELETINDEGAEGVLFTTLLKDSAEIGGYAKQLNNRLNALIDAVEKVYGQSYTQAGD